MWWWAPAAMGADWDVCPPDDPWRPCDYTTIADAIAAVGPDDRIVLLRGTYTERVQIFGGDFTLDASEAVFTDPPDATVVDDVVRIEDSAITIEGLRVATALARPLAVYNSAVVLQDPYLSSTGMQEVGGLVLAVDAELTVTGGLFDGGAAAFEGAHLAAERSSVELTDCVLRNGVSTQNGGSIAVTSTLDPVDVTITGCTFEDNIARGAGGAVYVNGEGAALHVATTAFARNRADVGGALYSYDVGWTVIDSTFVANEAAEGGALATGVVGDQETPTVSVGAVDLRRSLFCGNRADRASAMRIVTDEASILRNLRVVHNDAVSATLHLQGPITLGSSTVADNEVLDGSAIGYFGGAHVVDTLLVRNVGPRKPVSFGSPEPSFDHDLWWLNHGDDAPTGSTNMVEADPWLPPTPDCAVLLDPVPFFAPPDAPSYWGAGRDAGHPDRVDPDGTRIDIGAYGGVELVDPPWDQLWADSDADGDPTVYDCEVHDDLVGPTVYDTPYDGIDGNCDGSSDFDVDEDGYEHGAGDCDDTDAVVNPDAVEVAYNDVDEDCDGDHLDADGDGYPVPDDCDDTDALIHPGVVDDDDGDDDDCDGYVDRGDVEPRSCATAPPGAWGAVFGLVGLLGRRRRSAAPR